MATGRLPLSILHSSFSTSSFRSWLKVASPYPPFQSGAQVESVVLCGGDGAPHLRAHKPERSSTEAMASPGDTMLRECTGICIESSCPDATCFLTSTNLILYTWPRDKITESFTIKSTPSRSSGCHWVDRESSVIC
ncbi:uncharacterized protein [Triticum aestivum]|uniref:Uncharacterized protein n=1 Tax=Aegilops tauschii subsp. strangulata TaxID=200361 RepID=A0A453FJM7_AEGTS|nr:uncharacterized protein LOC123079222 isoform X2 [Triticum aestivum]